MASNEQPNSQRRGKQQRAKTSPASNRGSYAPRCNSAPATNLSAPDPQAEPASPGLPTPVRPAQPGVPPDIGTTLVEPRTCRKCGGDGTYMRASGMPDICAPCSGSGQVEGNKAAIRARKDRAEFRTAFMRHLYDVSRDAADAANMLDADEPERFEKAMSAWAAGRHDLVRALETYRRERMFEAEPKSRLRYLARTWDPAEALPGVDVTTREGAFNRCKDVSAAYVTYINGLGEEHLSAEWIQVEGMKRECPDADPRWLEIDQAKWTHYAARVSIGDPNDPDAEPSVEIVDFTLRQFDPQASSSWSGSEKHYGHLFETTYEIPDGVAERHVADLRRDGKLR